MRRLLAVFFRLLYNEFAWTYDLVSWVVSAGQWRAWQRTALAVLQPGPTLEVGHGPGHMLLAISRGGEQAFGIDLSLAMGGLAGRRLRRHGLPARLGRAAVQALPFSDASFANLLATFPTEYIVDPQALREFARVLRPGGRLVVVPVAEITGPAPVDRAAALLFRITGQSTDAWFAPVLERFAQAGLPARIESVRLARSRVTLIIAEADA
ncbi:MAG TPA: methyltransferase domain-containing protein [Anaerolineales bacterium]|nr:methyltransferase domain-containing protein [Anaerolineales bacterium]HRF48458.1 methyltransferase domain-containing protein [Anaerolineales bacterium]